MSAVAAMVTVLVAAAVVALVLPAISVLIAVVVPIPIAVAVVALVLAAVSVLVAALVTTAVAVAPISAIDVLDPAIHIGDAGAAWKKVGLAAEDSVSKVAERLKSHVLEGTTLKEVLAKAFACDSFIGKLEVEDEGKNIAGELALSVRIRIDSGSTQLFRAAGGREESENLACRGECDRLDSADHKTIREQVVEPILNEIDRILTATVGAPLALIPRFVSTIYEKVIGVVGDATFDRNDGNSRFVNSNCVARWEGLDNFLPDSRGYLNRILQSCGKPGKQIDPARFTSRLNLENIAVLVEQ